MCGGGRAIVSAVSLRPENIVLMPEEVAIKWNDGSEDFFPMATLRAASPSAETAGEKDILGNQYGGESGKDYSDVRVRGYEPVGGYAVRFLFTDGHHSGLYSFDYLKKLAARLKEISGAE